jgi:HEAT repeat protein
MGESASRCGVCGEVQHADGLPDWNCWDHRATAHEVRTWVESLRANRGGPALRILSEIGAPPAAPALREYLTDPDPRILRSVVTSLGWSGDASDASELIRLAAHDDPEVRISAIESLAELEIPDAARSLRERLGPPTSRREHDTLVRALAWLRDPIVLDELRGRLETGGPSERLSRGTIAESLARVGTAADRAKMADLAIAELDRAAADSYIAPQYVRTAHWSAYVSAVEPVAPDEVAHVRASLSAEAALALTYHPYQGPTSTDIESGHGPRTVPRRAMRFVDGRPSHGTGPWSKFGGQPEWLDRPNWPSGPDGLPLIFYGQIEVEERRVAYLFVGPPGSWVGEPNDDWVSVVVQPGGGPIGEAAARATGPILYDWSTDRSRFRRRSRRVPSPERHVEWVEGADPVEYRPGGGLDHDDANKVGGTPWWLQGAQDLGPGWTWSFQFEAGLTGHDFADAAVVYGFLHDDGGGTLTFDSH